MFFVSLGKTEVGPSLKMLELSDTRRKLDLAIGQ
jgi:hypothetical protein